MTSSSYTEGTLPLLPGPQRESRGEKLPICIFWAEKIQNNPIPRPWGAGRRREPGAPRARTVGVGEVPRA